MKRATLVCLMAFACNRGLQQPQDAPPPAPAQAPAAPAGDAAVEGRFEVAAAIAEHIQEGDTIFVMARSAAAGNMVAVAKLTAPKSFPLPFRIGPQNVMIPGGALAGPLKLSARVDKDGDAMSRNPGDVTAELPTPVPVPSQDVVLTFDRVM